MILGQLGRSEEAQPVIEAALRRKPDVGERFFDMAWTWNIPDPQIEYMAIWWGKRAALPSRWGHGPEEGAFRNPK